jgi:hypothetical protein
MSPLNCKTQYIVPFVIDLPIYLEDVMIRFIFCVFEELVAKSCEIYQSTIEK